MEKVSIQLVSPASGELLSIAEAVNILVSIQLVSPASGELLGTTDMNDLCRLTASFHSISFPSEWGELQGVSEKARATTDVSIQLVSPASGE